AEDHRLIAPWSERVRYRARKNGYHGGLTPQEMVIPITVLVAGDIHLAGWGEAPDQTPEWWEAAPAVSAVPALVPLLKPPEPETPRTLWDAVEPEPIQAAPATGGQPAPPPAWLANLLASPLFIE